MSAQPKLGGWGWATSFPGLFPSMLGGAGGREKPWERGWGVGVGV